MIPRNIFLMWDKPRDKWPALVELCVDLWVAINPNWNVEIFDIEMARACIGNDIDINIFNSLKVQHQSDLVRTKLLSTRGGIWADASCLPHMSVDVWISSFEHCDYSSIPTLAPGQVSDNWFLISKKSGILMTKQYATLIKYWRTPKINLPQDERSISMISDNWRQFISEFAAHELRIAPYFLWQYLFKIQVETDKEFSDCFEEQKFLSTNGDCGFLIRQLRQNKNRNIPNNPITDEIYQFLMKTDAQLSKLNHHSVELDYPLFDFRNCVLNRFSSYV